MTVRLRIGDFAFDDHRINLGGRTIATRDIVSIAIQRRTSAALLTYGLISLLLFAATIKVDSFVGNLAGACLAAAALLGARYEWQHPYVLVLNIYQLGTFEVVGFPKSSLPKLVRFAESV